MSGVLAAINEFASDAFGESGASLRQIDLGDARVYLRASPLYLLAARCSGVSSPGAERLLDDAFLSTIERCQTLTALPGTAAPYQGQLGRLQDQLSLGFDGLSAEESRSSISPALMLLGVVGLVLAGIGGWIVLDSFFAGRAHDIARAAITATPGTKGYLVDIDVGPFGRRVSLTGLTQDDTVKSGILERLRSDLLGVSINDHLTTLPGAQGEIGPAIERAEIAASLQRAALRLETVTTELPRLSAASNPRQRQSLDHAATLAASAARDLRDPGSALRRTKEAQFKLSDQLRHRADEVAAMAAGKPAPEPSPSVESGQTAADIARQLELAADQLAIVTAAVVQADAIRRNLPAPAAPIVRAPDIAAFERLSVYVRTRAVFFADDLTYRDDAQTAKTLDELAGLMKGTEALLRVVGYTDAKGTADRNTELSENRARKVLDALTERGVPAARLVAVGRHDANQIASAIGETSPNRRVEFELGFDGEAGQ